VVELYINKEDMTKILKIINEEIQRFKHEGVADIAAEKMFNIPDPNTEREKIALKGIEPEDNMGELSGTLFDGTKIYKNPKSLQNFGNDVRAISDANGDLFVIQNDTSIDHSDIGDALKKSGALNIFWGSDVYLGHKYITFHRIGYSNIFGISVSYLDYLNAVKLKDIVDELFDAVKNKNPQFEYVKRVWNK
jgi:hypothetical protein